MALKVHNTPRWTSRLLTTVACLMVCSGVYILIVSFAPLLQSPFIDPSDNTTTQLLTNTAKKTITKNHLYIPKIDVNLPYNTGDARVMEYGAWWRQPKNGNPRDGGNFVLSAHRFIMGLTPEQTLRKSPFYNINHLQMGDEIIIDFEGKRYKYIVTEIFKVNPEDVHIEAHTSQPRLTLYSCTLGGAQDGREVFIATPKEDSHLPKKSAS